MIKNKGLVYLIVGLTLLSAGCSDPTLTNEVHAVQEDEVSDSVGTEKVKNESQADDTQITNEDKKSENKDTENRKTDKAGKSGSETESRQASQLIGKVVTIHGNFIQIDKVDLPERMVERMNKDGQSGQNASENQDGQKTNLASAMAGPQGERGQGKEPRNGQRGGSLENMEFSGEIVDVMIPVGSAINQMSDPSLELSYNNLKKGMVIRIKVDQEMTDELGSESDTSTIYADTVLIME